VVTKIVLLDAGPLGLVTNPKQSPASLACATWLQNLIQDGTQIVVPEIADYEVRRELIRARKKAGLQRLDALIDVLTYLPITTDVMREAAVLWAFARQSGQPTADRHALDGDVILAAQARLILSDQVVIATTNVGHLSRFASAYLWTEI